MFAVPASFGEGWSAKLNHPETGIGNWSEQEFIDVVKWGKVPNSRYGPRCPDTPI